jgi:hypothetical protein
VTPVGRSAGTRRGRTGSLVGSGGTYCQHRGSPAALLAPCTRRRGRAAQTSARGRGAGQRAALVASGGWL